jgi:hypothetical protein
MWVEVCLQLRAEREVSEEGQRRERVAAAMA